MDETADIDELRSRLRAAEAELRRRATVQEALEASEEKFRTLFASIDEGFCIVEVILDEAGRPVDLLHVEANPAYERYTGLHDIVGKRALEIVPEGGPWLEFYGNVALTGQAARDESYLVAPVERWIAAYASRIGGEGSLKVAIVFNDITERKQAEQALRASEARLRTVLDGIGEAFYALDRDWRFLFASRVALKTWGRTSEDVIGHGFLDRFPEAIGSEAHEAHRRVMATGVAESFETMSPVLGRWIGVDIAPTPQGGLSVAFRDIDARKRAEQAVRASEERFARFAASSSDGLWIRDAATLSMEYVSPAIGTIYGIEPDAVLGAVERWAGMILPEDREIALAHLDEARRGRAAVHEFRIQRPSDGAFRWIRNTDFPLYGDGRVDRIGGIAHDTTEEKLAAEHQGILLAELQHRVRNIMAIIRAIASRSAERAGSVPDYAEILAGRLLALSRVQALLTRGANVSVRLRTIIVDEISVQAQHEGQYDIEGPDIEVSPKAAEVLTLAFHELSTNALKYGALSAPDGKVTVRWEIVDKRGTRWLSLDWAERGAPAPPPPDEPRREGFGSELIEGRIPYELRGRGRLVVAPEGARCHLEFPLLQGASVLETGAPRRATVFGGVLDMTGEPDLANGRVLVVEDDYYQAIDMARALRGAGAEVLGPCGNEAAAREELAGQRPDAVLLDINLGDGATFKIAEILKDRGIPFAFVTGYDQVVIPAEFDGIERLEKPVLPRQIVGAAGKLLSRPA